MRRRTARSAVRTVAIVAAVAVIVGNARLASNASTGRIAGIRLTYELRITARSESGGFVCR